MLKVTKNDNDTISITGDVDEIGKILIASYEDYERAHRRLVLSGSPERDLISALLARRIELEGLLIEYNDLCPPEISEEERLARLELGGGELVEYRGF